MISSINLGNASMLWAGLLIPLLVLAYLKTKRDIALLVPSVMVLRAIKQQTVLRSKIKLPWRFYLELLMLCILLCAATLPSKPGDNQKVAMVIDNSLSMQALDHGAKTRLELAKDHALSFLAGLSSADQVIIYSSSPRLSALSPKSESPSSARERVSRILPSAAGSTLSGDLKNLAESGRFSQVVLISDEALELTEVEDPLSGNNIVTEIKGVRVGSPSENYFISNLAYQTESLEDDRVTIVANIGWSGLAATAVNVIVDALDPSSFVPENLQKSTINISPSKAAEFSSVIPIRGDKWIEVRLENAKGVADSIKVDNRAWLPPLSAKKSAILLVSQESSLWGLDRISSLQVESITPKEFALLGERRVKNCQTLIFHKSAPVAATGVPSLFILPPDMNNFFPVAKSVERGHITSWSEQHPLINYLRVPVLPINGALVFSPPLWAQAVINIGEGPVVVAGESEGVRYVGVGTELLPFEGAKTAAQSVLTINALNWLLGSSGTVGNVFITGALYPLDRKKAWKVITFEGKTSERPTFEKAVRVISRDDIEGHEVLLSESGPMVFIDQDESEKLEVAVNVFHPADSATTTVRKLTLPNFIESQRSSKEENEPIWPSLLKLVLLLLVADWAIRIYRGRKIPRSNSLRFQEGAVSNAN